ncbi:hypothetical protein Trydic_g22874 [Trypoxylus dichotomus]
MLVLFLTGPAVAMIGANLRFGSITGNASSNATKVFQCHPGGTAEAALIFALGSMGMAANVALMAVILANRQLRRSSEALLAASTIHDANEQFVLCVNLFFVDVAFRPPP